MFGIKQWVFNERRKTMNSNLATHFSTGSRPPVLEPRLSTHLPRLRRGPMNGIGPMSAAADHRIIPLTQVTLAGDNDHGDFIALLTSVLERFVNCPPEQLERHLQSAFHQVCQSLGIETAGLWRLSSSVGESFSLAQLYPVAEVQR